MKDHTKDVVEYNIGGEVESKINFHFMVCGDGTYDLWGRGGGWWWWLGRRFHHIIMYMFITPELFFLFQDVSLSSITPLIGPKSGYTRLTITGENLDIGSSQQVTLLGDYVTCEIQKITCVQLEMWRLINVVNQRKSDFFLYMAYCHVMVRMEILTIYSIDAIECLTPAWVPGNGVHGPIRVEIDGARMQPQHIEYTYKEDPTITYIKPLHTIRRFVKILILNMVLYKVKIAINFLMVSFT